MRNRIFISCGIAIVLSSFVLNGCKKEQKEEAAQPAQTATAPAPAAAPAPASTDPNKPTEAQLTDDLKAGPANAVNIENASMEQWDKTAPTGWTVRQKAAAVEKSADATDGKTSVAVPAGKTLNYIYQNIPLNASMAGKRVYLTAMAKSTEPGKTVMWGYTMVDKVKSDEIHGAPHPGDGQWHRIGFSIQLPANITEGKLCCVLESAAAGKPAVFDDVKVYIK